MTHEPRAGARLLEGLRSLERATSHWEHDGDLPGPIRERLEDLAARLSRLLARGRQVAETTEPVEPARQLVGNSSALQGILSTIARIAPRDSHVLITGESGTGKELVARAVHDASSRSSGCFVPVDCGSIADTLLESELFGHRKGAFTGALHDRAGLLEEASGGTLFLDELANSSPSLQTRLLRVLQEGEIRRVGENRSRRVDLRVIAATSGNLESLVRRARFREDLYYRLNVVHLALPTLRQRPEDIPMLIDHFVAACSRRYGLPPKRFTPAAVEVLLRYPWPGNVRELQNVIERSLLLATGDAIAPDGLPVGLLDALLDLSPSNSTDDPPKSGEHRLIERALLESNGDKSRAARLIGWHRTKLYRRLRAYRIPYDFGRERASEG